MSYVQVSSQASAGELKRAGALWSWGALREHAAGLAGCGGVRRRRC